MICLTISRVGSTKVIISGQYRTTLNNDNKENTLLKIESLWIVVRHLNMKYSFIPCDPLLVRDDSHYWGKVFRWYCADR